MPIRAPQPGQSLADKFPTVAATWHPTANEPHTPHTVSSKVSLVARWRCPAGHEWDEQVSTRTNKPGWKRGDVAACRVCVGFHVTHEFPCGHTAPCDREAALREKCPDCHAIDAAAARATWQEAQAARERDYRARQQQARLVYDQCEAEARASIAAITPADEVPEPLLAAWRADGLRKLRSAIAAERAHGKTGAAGQVPATLRRQAVNLVPTVEELAAASAACEPVVLAEKAHWPAGWLWHRARAAGAQPSEPVADTVLIGIFTAWLEHCLTDHPEARLLADFAVSDMTWWLTERLFDLTRNLDKIAPSYPVSGLWRTRREFSLPVVPDSRSGFGRADVVIMRSNDPDVVIEIDSAHNAASVTKLEFARDAGAIAVWVRWHGGRVHPVPGVAGIDLVEQTRRLGATSR